MEGVQGRVLGYRVGVAHITVFLLRGARKGTWLQGWCCTHYCVFVKGCKEGYLVTELVLYTCFKVELILAPSPCQKFSSFLSCIRSTSTDNNLSIV